MKKVAVNAAIEFITRSLLRYMSADDLNRIVIRAYRYQASDAAKREYIQTRVRGKEHDCSESVVRLVTEMAIYQHKTRDQ